jgi:hypothetical protein
MVPEGQFGGNKRGNYFYICILERNIWWISIKLGTNISSMMGIEVYSNEGPSRLQRGDNHKSSKIGLGHVNFFFHEPQYHKSSDLHECFLICIQWNFSKPDPHKTGPPWISADFLSLLNISLQRKSHKTGHPSKPAIIFGPSAGRGFEKFHCSA